MNLKMELGADSYNIIIERGGIKKAGEYFNLNRKVLVVTDSGVPKEYAKTVCDMAKEGYIFTFLSGEENKNFDTYKNILSHLVEKDFSRCDCVVAVGGGVVGDIAGFAAASYMRGIDFYNIPTTTLSQIDSSIGGKTAIDFLGYKNIIGAFYQPKCVIVDTTLTKTQTTRQRMSGICEAVKMAATCNAELFELFENDEVEENIEKIVTESLKIKKDIVEKDVKESGLRRVLNFGHTVGHAIETTAGLGKYYHGECVGLGMLAFASDEVRERIKNVLKRMSMPCDAEYDTEKIIEAIRHDKKASGNEITVVYVKEIGTFELLKVSIDELFEFLGE